MIHFLLQKPSLPRYNYFRPDPRLTDVKCADINGAYLKSGFDKGHSTPSGKQILNCSLIKT